MPAKTRRLERTEEYRPPRWTLVAAAVAAVVYVVGIAPRAGAPHLVNLVWAVGLSGTCLWGIWEARVEEKAKGLDGGTSLCLVVAGFGLARYLEGFGWPTYPLVYLVLAFVVTFQPGRGALGTLAGALAVMAGAHLTGTTVDGSVAGFGAELVAPIDWRLLGVRGALMSGFGLFSYLVLGSAFVEQRRRREQDAVRQREDLLDRAREFRLLNAGRTGTGERQRRDVEEYAVMDAVEAVERSIFETLSMLQTSLDCHTCLLLWFDVGQDSLHIKELISESDALVEGSLDPAQGVLGSITRCRETVHLRELRPGFRGLSYYRGAEPVEHFLGVPLIEEGHMRGILCVDRVAEKPFGGDEIELVEQMSESILHSVENERIFKSVEATKFELGQFFQASRRLNSVLSLDEVLQAAMESAADVVDYDFGAVTLCESEGGHRIAAVDADEQFDQEVDEWIDRRFDENAGLVSMAVKNQHYLPYGGRIREGETVPFTRREDLSMLRSLLVLPLIARDEAIGTLVVGMRQPGGIQTERREMLEVIANQVAVSLQNARLYQRMEELATTDDLTGLPNRRTFDRKLNEAMARHDRADRSFGLILLDIDHFKSVNDTWGHTVGDRVLEDVSTVLEESVREIDVPARYGGEEFAVILEETELEEALRVADRIRRQVAELEFRTDGETFSCTVSLGIGIWPGDASDEIDIVDAADEALYASKEGGRDQVTAWREMR
jgi:diguanylate cyclase (GGDEF)-like protein